MASAGAVGSTSSPGVRAGAITVSNRAAAGAGG